MSRRPILKRVAAIAATAVLIVAAAAAPAFALPNPKPWLPDGTAGKVDKGLGVGMYIAIAACILGIFGAAIGLAVDHRGGRAGEHAKVLAGIIAACVLIASATGIVGAFIA